MKILRNNMLATFTIAYVAGGTIAIILSLCRGYNRADIGFAFLAGALLSLLISGQARVIGSLPSGIVSDNKKFFKASMALWAGIFALSAFTLAESLSRYYLTMEFFLLVCAMALIIAFQTLLPKSFGRRESYVVLSEILVLSLYMGISLLYLFPGSYGNDASFHIAYISGILNRGSIVNNVDAAQYLIYPIYHITFAMTMLLGNMDIKSAQLVLLLAQVLSVIGVFALLRRLFNQRVALLSALLFSFSSQVILPRFSFYPGNYTIIYFILIMLVCLAGKSYVRYLILLLLIVVVNFTHPIASLIALFVLTTSYLVSRVFKYDGLNVDAKMLAACAVLIMIQWTRQTTRSDLLTILLNYLGSSMGPEGSGAAVTQATLSPYYSWTSITLYELGFALLILLGVCGAMMVLKYCIIRSKKNSPADGKIVLSAVTLAIVPIPYLLALMLPQVLPDRWFVYVTFFVCAAASVSLYAIYRLNKKFRFFVYGAILVIVFFSITSPLSNPDSHVYSTELSTRAALIPSEISAAGFVSEKDPGADYYMNSAYIAMIGKEMHGTCQYIDARSVESNAGIVLIRNYDLAKGISTPLFGTGGRLLDNYPCNDLMDYLQLSNAFYDNGQVRAYDTGGTKA